MSEQLDDHELDRRPPTSDDLVLMWLAGYRAAQRDVVEALDGPRPARWRAMARRYEEARRALRSLLDHELR